MPTQLFVYILIYYAFINITAFILFGLDKAFAKAGAWRISERSLLLFAGFGGGLGAFLSMRIFHHKTSKPKFTITVPLFAAFHLVLAALLWFWLR